MNEELNQKLKHYRISTAEYDLICNSLGREPRGVEWALFSALWSEHCSYKSSRVHLKKFFSQSERVLESFGENAGVIDLGEGERVAFKMESHNHPSYIEPYEGAATGVGGILRDIFTMGARPIAIADYLCFGEPTADRMESLVDGVVRGIGGYGNCVGVPTITGQTEFDQSYNDNILVNAFALGLFRPGEKVFTSREAKPGQWVVYVGAKTGKDGVHGASMASESFDEDSESKKPTIQKGDPFLEKLLIESCIEVMGEDLVEAIQDMGAAGITSSSFEMASKAGVGFNIQLDKVPLRDSSLTPEEILLSESQERMLLVCQPEKLGRIKEIFSRWDLDAEVIGEVIAEKEVRLSWHNEEICAIDPDILVENAPAYERPYTPWVPKNRVDQVSLANIKDANKTLLQILEDVRGNSRQWIYDQYDQRVGGKTSRDCKDSVAVVRLPDSGRALGIVLGCRPHMMRFDVAEGAKDAVAYPALELAAKGFEALAITDCLNFGNPEKPKLMSEFVAAVESMSAQCEALNTPVISGNVSLYNETLNENVTSTPSTGVVGLRDSLENIPQSHFVEADDEIFLLRMNGLQTKGFVAEVFNEENTGQGEIDTKKMALFTKQIKELSGIDGVRSTRLVGKFGLAYALSRMTHNDLGAEISLGDWVVNKEKPEASLFSENLYEVIFVTRSEKAGAFREAVEAYNGEASLWRLGHVKKSELKIGEILDLKVNDIQSAYTGSWEKTFATLN